MLDDDLPVTLHMAALPTMPEDYHDFDNDNEHGDSNALDDLFTETPPSPLSNQQQHYLSPPPPPLTSATTDSPNDHDLSALLTAANHCTPAAPTPPPFDTVNPSALSSPAANDLSDDSALASPFDTADFPLFSDAGAGIALSCLPAVIPHSHNHHHYGVSSSGSGAFSDPHPSPASTPGALREPFDDTSPALPIVQQQQQHQHFQHHGLPFPSPRPQQRGWHGHHHHSSSGGAVRSSPRSNAGVGGGGGGGGGVAAGRHRHHPYGTLVRAHSQPPEDVGPPHPLQQHQHQQRGLRHPYFQNRLFQQQHHQHQHAQQPSAAAAGEGQPPMQITFQRASGHYLGEPRGARHPFPPAAAMAAAAAVPPPGTPQPTIPFPVAAHGSPHAAATEMVLGGAGAGGAAMPPAPPPVMSRGGVSIGTPMLQPQPFFQPRRRSQSSSPALPPQHLLHHHHPFSRAGTPGYGGAGPRERGLQAAVPQQQQQQRRALGGGGPTSAPLSPMGSPMMAPSTVMMRMPVGVVAMPMTPPPAGGECHLQQQHHHHHQGGGGGLVDGDRERELAFQKKQTVAAVTSTPTTVLGLRGYVERLENECEGMREILLRDVGDESQDEGMVELERKRLEKRNKNSEVTELDELLQPLPRSIQLECGIEDVPWDVPENGQEVRDLDLTALLEAYDIPFLSSMFLGQKKELYLRFIGASKELMHRVLD